MATPRKLGGTLRNTRRRVLLELAEIQWIEEVSGCPVTFADWHSTLYPDIKKDSAGRRWNRLLVDLKAWGQKYHTLGVIPNASHHQHAIHVLISRVSLYEIAEMWPPPKGEGGGGEAQSSKEAIS